MKYPLVRLDWLDASSHDSWQVIEDAKPDQDFTVHTIGWLLNETKKYYVLGTGLSSNGLTAATWRIPKGMVVKRINIKGHDIEYQ